MKNNILKLLFLFLIISCSKDDASKDTILEEPKILPKKFQLLAQTQYGEFITAYECSFSYNEKKQINKLDISSPMGNENIRFTYGNHGLPTQMDVVTLQDTKQFNFDYDGILLSGFSVDGDKYPILHNVNNNSYSFEKEGDPATYFLNSINDIVQLMGVNPNGSTNLYVMAYEDDKNGFLSNINFPLNLYLEIVSYHQLFLMMSHAPLLQANSYTLYEYTNAFDEDDFVVESVMDIDQNQNIIRYEYQEL
jgi:hypothetical protein